MIELEGGVVGWAEKGSDSDISYLCENAPDVIARCNYFIVSVVNSGSRISLEWNCLKPFLRSTYIALNEVGSLVLARDTFLEIVRSDTFFFGHDQIWGYETLPKFVAPDRKTLNLYTTDEADHLAHIPLYAAGLAQMRATGCLFGFLDAEAVSFLSTERSIVERISAIYGDLRVKVFISTTDLRKICDVLIDHLRSEVGKEVNVYQDSYWIIPEPFHRDAALFQLEIGSLRNDWEALRLLAEKKVSPDRSSFMRLAHLLRYVAEHSGPKGEDEYNPPVTFRISVDELWKVLGIHMTCFSTQGIEIINFKENLHWYIHTSRLYDISSSPKVNSVMGLCDELKGLKNIIGPDPEIRTYGFRWLSTLFVSISNSYF